ncbi:hypothetical protein KTO58_08825 [Chitinophaga pendula]|uniref:hypothetical protein n=1 Tax=Chitinophaga TaxID=79328 RepID=UPI000BB098F8|nr:MULTISPECIES: hypothetical protein [Chitinophaga]ASZ13106.1 hypothetical protein CK934_20145 [Chitinophaga sp. MD30]UCJ09271.1 hypothetical protein KTO58_08825 [Chitinophaga pendula]
MKFIGTLLLIVILSYLAGMFLPWWSVALVAFLVSLLIRMSPGKAFFTGFLGVFLLWLALAFYIDVRNDHILANRMSLVIMQVKSPVGIGLISAFIGGLVAGFASTAASYLRKPAKQVATA